MSDTSDGPEYPSTAVCPSSSPSPTLVSTACTLSLSALDFLSPSSALAKNIESINTATIEREPTPEPIYPLRFHLGNASLQTPEHKQQIMSTDVAANILFGDLRSSYDKQHARVDSMRQIAEKLEMQFLASVRDRATRPGSSITENEKMYHDQLRRSLNRTRLQLADEVKLLQWLRRRHNMAVISRKARTRYLVY
ncbi:hypothetical protein LPJ53_004078 [Coemansia erecta]|uniref:Uncharacterized protein n=1 Tax=Coemansia erecta TaxID=147472 RepID=A0A9W7XXX7_9FUNG|nr:hypothetical protein LPJ53_004078 [Coemansia erecta]